MNQLRSRSKVERPISFLPRVEIRYSEERTLTTYLFLLPAEKNEEGMKDKVNKSFLLLHRESAACINRETVESGLKSV